VNFTDVNEHTKKVISNKQYKSMGKISFTTPDKITLDLEKTFSLESSGSVLNYQKKNKEIDKVNSLVQEIETLKESLQNRLERKSTEKKAPLRIVENQLTATGTEIVNVPDISTEAVQTINALVHAQNFIVQELTEVFDNKFEKFDEIIVELIRCKTENERLKQKIDNLTRDNYKLKKDVESFKSIVPGLYIKRELDKTKF